VVYDQAQKFNDGAFKIAGIPEGGGEIEHSSVVFEPVFVAPAPRSKANALRELKLTLPSTRNKIQALRVGVDKTPSSDPSMIGPLIRDYYGKVWKAADVGDNRKEVLRDYLEDYNRLIDHNDLVEINIDLVPKAIRMAPDTSPGPDGVPFCAFKANAELSATVILEVCRFLGVKRS
jgi:hypothetical protein